MNEKILDRLEQRPKTDEEIVRLADNIEALIASVELTDEEKATLCELDSTAYGKYDQLSLSEEDRRRVAELILKADGIRKPDGKTAYGVPIGDFLEYFKTRYEGCTGKTRQNKITLGFPGKDRPAAEIAVGHLGDVSRFLRSEIVVRVPVPVDLTGLKPKELMLRINALNSNASCGTIVRDKKGRATFIGKVPFFYPGNYSSWRTLPSIPELKVYRRMRDYNVDTHYDIHSRLWDMALLAYHSFEKENVTVTKREPYKEMMAEKPKVYQKYGRANHWGPYFMDCMFSDFKESADFSGTKNDDGIEGVLDLSGIVTPAEAEPPDAQLTGTQVSVVFDVVRQEKIWPECLRTKAMLPFRMTFDNALKYADALNRKSVTDPLEMGLIMTFYAVDQGDDSTIVCSGRFIGRGGMHSRLYNGIGLFLAERSLYAVREIFGEKPIREWEGFKKTRL